MIGKFSLPIFAFIGFILALHAHGEESQKPVQIRAVLHAPMNPVAELYYVDKNGDGQPLNFRPKALSRAFVTIPVGGALLLHDSDKIDPENLTATLAAQAKLPVDIESAIIVVVPTPEGTKPAYRILVINDSEKAFPGGESLVLPLVNANLIVEAGEHTVPVRPGKLTPIPFVKKVNDFNMAQTNFHYHNGQSWVTFAERQLQYLKASRRLFIVHKTPGALEPTITTIVDTSSG